MRIDIGKDVIGSDGEKIGSVDRLVLDSETKDLREFVVHKGMLWSEDRLVALDLVSELDADGNVHLNVASNDEDTMPRFLEETHRVADEDETRTLGFGTYVGAAPYAPVLFAPGAAGGQYQPGRGPFFDAPVTGQMVLETTTNLPEDSMTIDKGTTVIGRDGDKVGEVEEIIVDEHGNTTGFLVKAGFVFTHDVQVLMNLVDHMSGEEITLNVSGDDAENMQQG